MSYGRTLAQLLERIQMCKILAGYKFKPNHKDIHFLVAEKKSDDYLGTFSTDLTQARRFNSQADATRAIYKELSTFSLDDDYEWTPVLTNENGEEFGNIRPIFKVGSPEFKKQDLVNYSD